MSYDPPKGMRKNREGVAVFEAPATAPAAGAGKRWHRVRISRRLLDGHGKTLKRDSESVDVFCRPDECYALAFRRSPDPWPGESGRKSLEVWVESVS